MGKWENKFNEKNAQFDEWQRQFIRGRALLFRLKDEGKIDDTQFQIIDRWADAQYKMGKNAKSIGRSRGDNAREDDSNMYN